VRATYLWLARIITALVVVQAMTIAFAVSGLFNWITEKAGMVDAAKVKSWDQTPPTFTGAIGHLLHVEMGEKLIPALALLLLIVSFFAKVSRGVVMALVLLVLVIVQVLSGIKADDLPYLGLLHGFNAFLIFGVAMAAAMKAKAVPEAAAA